MTASIEELVARAEIIELTSRYGRAMAEGDAEGWANLFTDDGALLSAFSGETRGHDALRDMATNVSRGPRGGLLAIVDFMITIDGDQAEQVCTGVIVERGDQPIVGRYHDELERTPAGWRFRQRRYVPVHAVAR